MDFLVTTRSVAVPKRGLQDLLVDVVTIPTPVRRGDFNIKPPLLLSSPLPKRGVFSKKSNCSPGRPPRIHRLLSNHLTSCRFAYPALRLAAVHVPQLHPRQRESPRVASSRAPRSATSSMPAFMLARRHQSSLAELPYNVAIRIAGHLTAISERPMDNLR
jgi:hypothetical protein